MKKTLLTLCVAFSTHALAADQYEFGVTLKGYEGKATSSVSYGGQIARHALHNSLKKVVGKGDEAAMLQYLSSKESGLAILDPVSKDGFKIKQTQIDELSKGKDLLSSAHDGVITGWPGNPTAQELLEQLVQQAGKPKMVMTLLTDTTTSSWFLSLQWAPYFITRPLTIT